LGSASSPAAWPAFRLGFCAVCTPEVRPTERRGVMYLGSSWITLAIFAAALVLRYAVRAAIPQRGSLTGTIGDALLAFAVAFIVASYAVIFRKYEALQKAKA
jgi:hypothetical protein